jgi:hypothetical protein
MDLSDGESMEVAWVEVDVILNWADADAAERDE